MYRIEKHTDEGEDNPIVEESIQDRRRDDDEQRHKRAHRLRLRDGFNFFHQLQKDS